MDLLKEGLERHLVIPTDRKEKLTIAGLTDNYTVYQISLDVLYYNDQNDRIATWISQYEFEHNIQEFDVSDREAYNRIIHQFITESNESALKETQNSIGLMGQNRAGVVLADGRILDGNRRFTCWRNLQAADNIPKYFEACILDRTMQNNKKQIKILELNLQHGEEEKVKYGPIEKLVGVYRDIIDPNTKTLTVEEYADNVHQDVKDIKQDVARAKLMIEFLEFINAPKQFYIARQFNLSDTLISLVGMLNKLKSDKKKQKELKDLVFSQLLMFSGDTRKYMREIGKIVSNPTVLNEYIENQSTFVDQACEKLVHYEQLSPQAISEIRADEELRTNFKNATERYVEKSNKDATKKMPLQLLDMAYTKLENIDIRILQKLSAEQKNGCIEKLNLLEQIINEIRSEIDV